MGENIIRGDDGRSYHKGADGRLSEIHDPKAHAKRLVSAISADHVLTGLRITNAKSPDDEAVVVTLSEAEGKKVLAAVKEVLKARAG